MSTEEPTHKPPERHPREALDSVLADEGPMPAARLGIRFQAFVFDWVFVNIFASLIIWKLFMPQAYPEAFTELNAWSQALIDWFGEKGLWTDAPMPEWSETLRSAMQYAQMLMFLAFWLYFATSEALFAGHSFGKSICRLRSISVVTMKQPFLFTTILRAGAKALAILSPFALLLTLAVLRFNKRRQMGHDLICRTAVIDERYMSSTYDQIK